MAGKTLTGIGDDESGRHELAADASAPLAIDLPTDTSEKIDQPTSARATDRMPMFAGAGSGPAVMPVVEAAVGAGFGSGGVSGVDDDKVAEGLKKLRSLDEPLGPIPSSMPTLKEGVPVVGGAPTPNPAAIAAAAASELLRSRGTAHGHALSVAAGGQGILVPISMDERMKGTLLGHSLHLPDGPEGVEESRPAEIRSVALVESPRALVTTTPSMGFSPGDSAFVEDDPLDDALEPETPRSKLMAHGTIVVAGLLVVAVAVFAWVRVRKAEAPPSVETHAPAPDNAGLAVPPPAPAPAAVAPPEPTAAAAPSPAPAPAVVPPPPPPVFPEEEPARPAVAAPARTHTRHAAAVSPAPHVASSPTHEAPSAPHTVSSAPPHAPALAPHAHETKPSAPGKRGKSVEDPDGTLPLTE